jgi:F0F1-type ATP synthase delta subunit
VELTQDVDPALRGGARIVMGDLLLDGSLGARLAQLRKALSAEHSHEN